MSKSSTSTTEAPLPPPSVVENDNNNNNNSTCMLCDPVSTTARNNSSNNNTKVQRRVNAQVPQDVLYPAYTNDYRVVHGTCGGLGMVANRFIAKGEIVLKDSIEFLFADVQEGDHILMVGHEMASVESETTVPERIPVTRDMLIRTHGVPVLEEDPTGESPAGIEYFRLEVPWMLLNHSCDPNVVDSSHKEPEGEAIAARDIQQGEELTYDYTHQYYDKDLHSFECLCEGRHCRKFVTGFAGLSDEDKVRLWPHVSDYIKVKHASDTGKGPTPRVQYPEFPPRILADQKAMRLVVPGPSCAASDVSLQLDESTGKYVLHALRDFAIGEEVYQFWNFVWPEQGRVPIDMVAASHLCQGDAPEGTVIRVHPKEHGVKDSMGRTRFSGYDMMTVHSCEPNLVYNYKDEDEEDDWRTTFAARPIRKGEILSIDYNTVWWDRSEVFAATQGCNCGSAQCRGTVAGFSHLSKKHQDELLSFSWLRDPQGASSTTMQLPSGAALSPHIHRCMRGKEHSEQTDSTDLSVTSSSITGFDGSSSSDEE